ncbi:MAG: hypothetical protein Q613_PSC00164G0001, partial [Propionibacterium sp. DORA_15]
VRHQNMETLEAIANRIVSDLEAHKGKLIFSLMDLMKQVLKRYGICIV